MTSTRDAILWASSGKMISFATAFISSIIIARYFMGPEEVGLFSLAFAATGLMAVLQEFGLNRYIVGEPELDDEKLRTAFSISLLVAWSVAIFIIGAAWPIQWLYGNTQLLPLLLVIGTSYFFVPLATVPTALLHRRMDFRSDFMVETSAAIANASVSLILAAMGWGAMALACGAFAQQIARALVSQWRNGWMLPWPLQTSGGAPLVRFGGGASLLQIFDSLGTRAPDLIVGGIIGSYAVGLYSRASGLAVQIILLLTNSVNAVFYPALARLRDEGKPLDEAYIRIVAGYTGVVFPAMAGLAVAAHPLVSALYGERWIEVAPILSMLAIAQMIVVAFPLSVQIPILLGQLRGVVLRSGISVLVMLVLFVAGTPYGLQGAAWAYIVYAVVYALLYGHFLHQLIAFSWRALAATYAISLICTLTAILPLILGYHYWLPAQQMGFSHLTILVGCGIIIWFIAVFVTRHPIRYEILQMASDIQHRLLPQTS